MVRQKFLDRMMDQGLHRHAAQYAGKLQLAVFRLGNASAGSASVLRAGKTGRAGADFGPDWGEFSGRRPYSN
jgi:hypothetical protein